MGADVVVCGPPTLLPAGLGAETPTACRRSRSTPPRPRDRGRGRRDDAAAAAGAHVGRPAASLREYSRLYQVNDDAMARAQPGAPVLHPGPMNEGVEISPPWRTAPIGHRRAGRRTASRCAWRCCTSCEAADERRVLVRPAQTAGRHATSRAMLTDLNLDVGVGGYPAGARMRTRARRPSLRIR